MSDPAQEGGDGALKTFAKQFAKNAEKQPGWVYVLIVAYLAISVTRFPSELTLAAWTIKLPAEVSATILAFTAYFLGDALDKVTFKKPIKTKEGKHIWVRRYQPPPEPEDSAIYHLGIRDGRYDVSMKLLEAAHGARLLIHSVNEFAKFVRSLIIPASLVAVILCFRALPFCGAAALSLAILGCSGFVALKTYPRLKTFHITKLYQSVCPLVHAVDEKGHRKFSVVDAGEARLFFWEGTFVASAKRASKRDEVCVQCLPLLQYQRTGLK